MSADTGKVQLLPTLPGYCQGVVDISEDEQGRKTVTFQCAECGALDPASPWTTTRLLFCVIHDRERGRDRLCPDCRTASLLGQGLSTQQVNEIVRR